MKRLRHYNKDLAVVLSIFGSSKESAMQQYKHLYDEIKESLPSETELRMAVSSRTILKNLEKQGKYHYTLPEQLAALDRLGYKKVVVASINVFPTEEHEFLLKIVEAFKNISKAKYEITLPIFTRGKKTNGYLDFLNDALRLKYGNRNIIYIAHGAPNLNSSGSQMFNYVRDYLKLQNPRNYFYTIESAFNYKKSLVIQEIERENSILGNNSELLLVSLLLVTGNHSINDIQEIKNELEEEYSNIEIPKNFLSDGDFSLLKLKETRKYFIEEILLAIKKINW